MPESFCADLPPTNMTITTEVVQAAAMEVSDLAEYYTYDPTLDTSGFEISNETYLIASELRHQVGIAINVYTYIYTRWASLGSGQE